MQVTPYIIKSTGLSEKSVRNTLSLLAQDCTLPFIARYRKEATGGLDEVEIAKIIELKEQFEVLEKRKKSILGKVRHLLGRSQKARVPRKKLLLPVIQR